MVMVYTTMLSTGNLFHLIGVAPHDQYQAYDQALDHMVRSVDISANAVPRARKLKKGARSGKRG
jgi:hypothetical protein